MSSEGQPSPTPTPAPATWYSGFDADTQAHVQNRGWDKLQPNDALTQAIKAHREAEKLIGVPAEKVLRLPKDINDKEGYGRIFNALGVPSDPKDYDFSGVKFADQSEPGPEFIENVRGLAAKYHLNKDDAKSLAADLVKQTDEQRASTMADYTAKLAQEQEALKTNWGAGNYNANLITARNAYDKILENVPADQRTAAMSALEKAVGYSTIMEMFRKIGAGLGEDKFVRTEGPAGGALTKEQAQQKLDANGKDEVWVAKLNKGDTATVQEFHNLTRLISGV